MSNFFSQLVVGYSFNSSPESKKNQTLELGPDGIAKLLLRSTTPPVSAVFQGNFPKRGGIWNFSESLFYHRV